MARGRPPARRAAAPSRAVGRGRARVPHRAGAQPAVGGRAPDALAGGRRRPPAAAWNAAPARLDAWCAEGRADLHFSALLELAGDEVLISFPGLPDCEARTRYDADVDAVAREALDTWLATSLARDEVPPYPVRLVVGELVHRAVPVPAPLAAALETHWRAADDALPIA